MNSHFRPRCCPPPTLLDWTLPQSCRGCKFHPKRLRISFWGGVSTDIYLLRPFYSGSADAFLRTPPPYPCHIPYTVFLPSVLLYMLLPPLSSAVHSLFLTESLLLSRGGRSFLSSSQSFSKVPTCQTTWSGFQTPPKAKLFPSI